MLLAASVRSTEPGAGRAVLPGQDAAHRDLDRRRRRLWRICPLARGPHGQASSPARPSIIVQSMPGAGGLLAGNYMYAQAAPDGLTIGILNSTVPLAPLWGSPGARFDPLKFNWLGGARARRRRLHALAHRAGQDLVRAPGEGDHGRLDRRRLADGGLSVAAQQAVRHQDQGDRRLQGRQRHRPRHGARRDRRPLRHPPDDLQVAASGLDGASARSSCRC